jgi:hypothetical protein
VAFVAIVWVIGTLWHKATDPMWKKANQKVLDKTGHERGQAAIKAKTEFVVPGTTAANLLDTVVRELSLPTQAPVAVLRRLIVVQRKPGFVLFASATKAYRAFVSSLVVVDGPGGAQGTYKMQNWNLSDGIVVDWKEMEVLSGRIEAIVRQMGGRITSAPETGPATLLSSAEGMTAFCGECGSSLAGGAAVCPECGQPVSTEAMV